MTGTSTSTPTTVAGAAPEPAAVEGDELTRKNAFRDADRSLERRTRLLTSLRVADLDRPSLKAKLDEIGTASA